MFQSCQTYKLIQSEQNRAIWSLLKDVFISMKLSSIHLLHFPGQEHFNKLQCNLINKNRQGFVPLHTHPELKIPPLGSIFWHNQSIDENTLCNRSKYKTQFSQTTLNERHYAMILFVIKGSLFYK